MSDPVDETSSYSPRFDGDGLMPAMAIEKSTGTPLMLAYVNAEAIEKSLETGFAVFWSRSRQKFWQKGETSGNRLKLIEILIDCDQDSLCMMVELEGSGAACHTGRHSCYYRKLSPATDDQADKNLTFTDDKPRFDPKKVYGEN